MAKNTDDQRDAFIYGVMGRVAAEKYVQETKPFLCARPVGTRMGLNFCRKYASYEDWKAGRTRIDIFSDKMKAALTEKADKMAADMLSGKPVYYGVDPSDSQKKDQDFVRWINRNKPNTRHTSNPAVDIKWPFMPLRRTSTSDVKDFNKSLRQDIKEICADVVDAGWTVEMMVTEIAKHVKS